MTTSTILSPTVLQEITDILSKKFEQPVQIKSTTQITDSERRNKLLRLHIENPGEGIPSQLIFKQTNLESSESAQEALGRLARDWAGLEFLSQIKAQDLHVPQFYGGSLQHHFVLLEDLGERHVSLVDALTGIDKDYAKAALHRFMRSLGQFHGAGYGKTDQYFEMLRKLNPTAESWEDDLKIKQNTTFPMLEALFKQLSISPSQPLWNEIHRALRARLEPGPFTTLIHGDNCPDNVFDNPDRDELYLIDFEWSFVRSALLDGTYLRMSMPTCWCSKAIPEDLIDAFEITYRAELMKKIPAAKDDGAYYKAYTEACAFWMVNILAEIEKAMDHDRLYYAGIVPEDAIWEPQENSGRSRVLSRLQAFINVAQKYESFPNLRSMAEHILKALKSLWPDATPLGFYSAFKKK
jgi:hypothetical protein